MPRLSNRIILTESGHTYCSECYMAAKSALDDDYDNYAVEELDTGTCESCDGFIIHGEIIFPGED